MAPLVQQGSALLSEIVVTALWTSTVLATCVTLALRILPELPARLRSLLWVLTFLVALTLPAAIVLLSLTGNGVAPAHLHLGIAWALPLAAAWVVYSASRVCGLLYGALYLRRLVSRAVPLSAHASLDRAEYPALRRVEVRVSAEVDRPCVAGYRHPVILLPAEVPSRLDNNDLRRILLHEVEHVRRFDDCVNLLQKLGIALFPFSPALLWMERRLCLERELACDDAVLAITGTPKAYAICLTQMAERRLHNGAAQLAVAAFGRQSELSRRVYSILQGPPRQASRWVYGAASVALLCALGTGTIALQRFGVPVAFGPRAMLTATAGPTVAAALSAQTASRERYGTARMTEASFHLPLQPTRTKAASARPTEFHGAVHRSRVQQRLSQTRSSMYLRIPQRQSVEQWIEYAPMPVEREQVPVLQQISYPYAIIPAGNVWLVVQL